MLQIFIPSYHGPFKNHIIELWKIHNKIIHIQLITLYIKKTSKSTMKSYIPRKVPKHALKCNLDQKVQGRETMLHF